MNLKEKKTKEFQKSVSQYEYKISKQYLSTWNYYFEEFKEFHKKKKSVVISRSYVNTELYNWYITQKILYLKKTIPQKHKVDLIKEGFYFGDSYLFSLERIEEFWLFILKDAIQNNEIVKPNHRYTYRGYHLGTWLVGVSQDNKRNKKNNLIRKINDLGFSFSDTKRDPLSTANRFIEDLLNDDTPIKLKWRTRFNNNIKKKKEVLPAKIIIQIEKIWYLKFSVKLDWGKMHEIIHDRTKEWKKFRYNKKLNPTGKWVIGKSVMGDLYYWTYMKKKNKRYMDLIKDNFNNQEKRELRKEGFPI